MSTQIIKDSETVKHNSVKREFVHATYLKSTEEYDEDCIFVKEHLHHADGTITSNFKPIKNYERPYWVTKKEFRDHNDKKEFEYEERLDAYHCTQTRLPKELFLRLKGYRATGYVGLREISNSPYVYGLDITPTVALHHDYIKHWPELLSDSTLAVADFETDVVKNPKGVKNTGLIISGVISFKDKIHLAITRDFLEDKAPNAIEDIKALAEEHLGDFIRERNIKITIDIVDNAALVVKSIWGKAHEWQPDFLGFWNIAFDISKAIEALEYYGYNPADVFSDPRVPKPYRQYHFYEDKLTRQKSNGDTVKKLFADLWHNLTAPASFRAICLMALYRRIRINEQQKSSYALDSILNHVVKLRKLKFAGLAEGLVKTEWHKTMQSQHKLEYMVYMLFDGLSVEILDDKTKDVQQTLRASIGVSDIAKMSSNPRRLSDDIYVQIIKDGKILGTTGDTMETPYDKLTQSLDGWIVALPADLTYRIGRNFINEHPNIETNISVYAFDKDIKSAYPTFEIILNVSKATRDIEVYKMQGLTDAEFRKFGINLTNVKGNALTLAQAGWDYPELDDLLSDFKQRIAASL